jgi:hypothetical protein
MNLRDVALLVVLHESGCCTEHVLLTFVNRYSRGRGWGNR